MRLDAKRQAQDGLPRDSFCSTQGCCENDGAFSNMLVRNDRQVISSYTDCYLTVFGNPDTARQIRPQSGQPIYFDCKTNQAGQARPDAYFWRTVSYTQNCDAMTDQEKAQWLIDHPRPTSSSAMPSSTTLLPTQTPTLNPNECLSHEPLCCHSSAGCSNSISWKVVTSGTPNSQIGNALDCQNLEQLFEVRNDTEIFYSCNNPKTSSYGEPISFGDCKDVTCAPRAINKPSPSPSSTPDQDSSTEIFYEALSTSFAERSIDSASQSTTQELTFSTESNHELPVSASESSHPPAVSSQQDAPSSAPIVYSTPLSSSQNSPMTRNLHSYDSSPC